MRSPDFYLKELLFDYDCVTVPGFGGFIIQSQPARIDQAKQRIHPPFRHISFNRLLSHDDGILASAITKAENVTYEEAGEIIRDFSNSLVNRIRHGEQVTIEGLGEFYHGVENEIIFKPLENINFNKSVYGMGPVNLYPVSFSTEKRIEKKRADRSSRDFREKKPASVKWTLALSIPVIIFLLYGIISPASMQKMYTDYSSMVFDWLRPGAVEQVFTEPSGVTDIPENQKIIEIAKTPEVITPEPVVKETVSQPVVEPGPRYYVIGGCFEKDENAEKFLAQLLKKGFEAEKAGATKHGHARISYKSFTEKQPALSFLEKIKDEENPSAWLLKY